MTDIQSIRNELLNKGLLYLAWITPVALGASLLRLLDHPWQSIYAIHIALASIFPFLAVFRKRLSYQFRIFSLLFLFFVIALTGFRTFALSGGTYFLTLIAVFSTLFLGLSAGLKACFLAIISTLLFGFAVNTGWIVFSTDFNHYSNSPTSWITKSVVFLTFMPVTVLAIGIINRFLESSLESVKKSQKDLLSEKEWLNVTLRSIGDGVITTDLDGKIVQLNKVSEKLTGWTQKEAQGQKLQEIFHIIHEKTGEECENPVHKVLTSGKTAELANHTVLISRDGTRYIIEDSAAPIHDAESKIIGVVLVYRDMTEKKRTAAELLKVKKLESVGVLAGGIAHDFNNILTAMLGNIDIAHMVVDDASEAKPLLEEAKKASLRARDLTRQLLTFAKGGDPIIKTNSVKKLIKESSNFVLRGSTVQGQFDFPEDLWLVEFDSGQLSQVFQNLVINARHAMPEGGVVHISCSNIFSMRKEFFVGLPDGHYVKITVRDTGCGIVKKYLDKIFDPYFSTKQEGSGLGLAISHSIIQKHGGDIAVQSVVGKGTTFTIFLPAAKEQQSAATSTTEKVHDFQARILVMDDDELIRIVAKKMLERLGHKVWLAKDGAETIRIFSEYHSKGKTFDVLIMDLTIPGGMGGKQAIQKILELDPEAKVIVSSGYSSDPVLANCRDYGFRAAIAKPFLQKDLKKILDEVLEG